MRTKDKFQLLTPRDLDVMNILWDTDKSMTASEIKAANEELTMNTVQAVIRKLLKNEYVRVEDIVYSGTVLSRSYRPTITSKDFAVKQLTSDFNSLKGEVSKTSLVAALLSAEQDKEKRLQDIEELQHMLNNFKANI